MKKKMQKAGYLYERWLFIARRVFLTNPSLSKEIVKDILQFSRKTKMPIPKNVKRFICKKCFSVLTPGLNLRVRLQDGHVVYLCKECKSLYRYPYLKKDRTVKSKGKKI